MKKKIYWLDNLKIIALLSIMTFHFWPAIYPAIKDFSISVEGWVLLQMPLRNGFEGSILFFIASGISLSLLANKKKTTLADFYRTRFLRIYIPFWIALAAAIVFYLSGINVSLTPAGSIPLWIANALLIEVPQMIKVQPHLWFLFVLVRLYLLFPFMYKFTKKTGVYGLIGLAIFHFAAYTAYDIYPTYILRTALAQIIAWIFPFCMGIFIGLRLEADREKTEAVLSRLFPAGLLLFALGIVAENYKQATPITFLLLSTGVIIVGYKIASLNWHLPVINKISYEVYLAHIIVLAIVSPILKPISTALFFAVFLLGSLAAGYLVNQASCVIYNLISNLSFGRRIPIGLFEPIPED